MHDHHAVTMGFYVLYIVFLKLDTQIAEKDTGQKNKLCCLNVTALHQNKVGSNEEKTNKKNPHIATTKKACCTFLETVTKKKSGFRIIHNILLTVLFFHGQ